MHLQSAACTASRAARNASLQSGDVATSIHKCSVLRGVIRDCGLAAGMLREAGERLQERDGWPEGTPAERYRHATAEATGLWRAAWALCAVTLPEQPGGEDAMQALDAAGTALAASTPSCVPCLSLAARVLERMRADAVQALTQRLTVLDRLAGEVGPLAGTDLAREAARLRALQIRQNLSGQAIGLAGMIPACLRDEPVQLDEGSAPTDWTGDRWSPDWGAQHQPVAPDAGLWR
ncbi:hypothetical protein ACFOD4_05800 [Pseudoroseomonas globiformis]|uniref:Uncharacterized protein n=1 Tax=Teichococcus globiformis TaxID=2307229 RepID=A0ABV7G1L7_9PROT